LLLVLVFYEEVYLILNLEIIIIKIVTLEAGYVFRGNPAILFNSEKSLDEGLHVLDFTSCTELVEGIVQMHWIKAYRSRINFQSHRTSLGWWNVFDEHTSRIAFFRFWAILSLM
jgi:hypothetical protein